MDFAQSIAFEGGGNGTSPVLWSATNLGLVNRIHPLYLNVEIYPTNFEVKADQYATVKVNGSPVNSHCTPEESCGTVWYSCVAELDVSGYKLEPLGGSLSVEVSVTGVNSGPCDYMGYPLYTRMFLRENLPTGEPTVMPSGEPSGQPSCVPTGQPSHQPTTHPSGQPTDQPSNCPSSMPTIQSTGQPSGVPTATPTFNFPLNYQVEKGGMNNVSFHVRNVGFINRTHPKYLSVGVWPTDFADKADQWTTIRINGEVVVPYCTPSLSCGRDYFYCVLEKDIFSYVQSALGGSFTVEVSTTGVNSGPCNHQQFPLYARLHVTERKPTEPKVLSVWIFVALCIGIMLLVGAVLWYLYSSRLKEKRRNYIPEEADVEMGHDNEDAADDDEIPYEDKLRVKPSRSEMYLRNLSRIAPVEEQPPQFSSLTSPNFRQKPPAGRVSQGQAVSHDSDVPKSPAPPLRTKHSHLHISRTVDGMSIIDSLDS
jgi:hypothetical protein